jgi:hypothetical protein
MPSVSSAWTVVPGARNQQEYLRGLRAGLGRVRGEHGGWWKLTRDVYAIGREMVREDPRTLPLAALGWAVPLITLANYLGEAAFVQYWLARYLQSDLRRRPATRIAQVIA